MTDLKFKPGDHVMVPAKVTEADSRHDDPAYCVEFSSGRAVWLAEAALASATLIERPLAVGDRVVWPASDWMPGTGRILDIFEGHAILRRLSGDGRRHVPLSQSPRLPAGISLEAEVIAKFNSTSEKYGFPERLPALAEKEPC